MCIPSVLNLIVYVRVYRVYVLEVSKTLKGSLSDRYTIPGMSCSQNGRPLQYIARQNINFNLFKVNL